MHQAERFRPLSERRNFLLAAFLIASLLSWGLHSEENPSAVYLTWQRDPSTTMTVQWLTDNKNTSDDVFYRKFGDQQWKTIAGTHMPMPKNQPYLIHKAEITGLDPGASYSFRTGDRAGTILKFRTMPKTLDREIRFVEGGDLYHGNIEKMIETHKQAAKMGPMFALVGGDIAYAGAKNPAEPRKDEAKRWLRWIFAWSENMKTEEGYLIPFLPCIGNHDVNGLYNQPKSNAPFFYALFAFPGPKGYNVIDFGNYLSIVALDSGHTNPIEGEQTAWLKETLSTRKGIPNKFAFYHVPAYPSVRKMKGKNSELERANWVPHFEEARLTAAFEHHDHAYKRTKPILKDEVDPKGVIYLGDGAWGVKNPRTPKKPDSAWYIAASKKERHFILISLDKNGRSFRAVKPDGEVIDTYIQQGTDLQDAKPEQKERVLQTTGI